MYCQNLSLSYGDHTLFTDVTFSISPGEKLAIIGKNGSGKTSILKLFLGQETPNSGIINIPKNYRLGYISQKTLWTEETILQEALTTLQNASEETHYKAKKILSGLGFTSEDFLLPIASFSGGYHLRLKLAKALISEPDCLFLDEPTNYLDILSIRFLKDFLHRFPKEVLIVSHDREFLDTVTTGVLGIHRGTIRKTSGSIEKYFETIALSEQAHEQTRLRIERKKEHMEDFIEKNRAKASKAKQAQSRLKALEKLPSVEELSCFQNKPFSFQEIPFHGNLLGKVEHISFSFQNSPLRIKDISFDIEKKDRIAIIGKNGYGKSTILSLLSGELHPSEGRIQYHEKTKIGVFGQTNIQRLCPNNTILEEIWSVAPSLTKEQAQAACGLMSFPGTLCEKQIDVLSGGEQSRVLLGKICARPTNLLLLDEPTHHLDMETIDVLIKAINQYQGAIILISHSELVLEKFSASKILICHRDRQELFLGTYPQFIQEKGFEEEKPPTTKSTEKEIRRLRAETIALRAKHLKPHKERIERIEKEILLLEKKHHETQTLYINATVSFSKEAGELAKQLGIQKKELDLLYATLCEAESTYTHASSQFPLEPFASS